MALSHEVNLTTGQPGVAGLGTANVTIDHYLGTQYPQVTVWALTTNNGNAVGDRVEFDINATSANRITITGDSAITSADYKVTITG